MTSPDSIPDTIRGAHEALNALVDLGIQVAMISAEEVDILTPLTDPALTELEPMLGSLYCTDIVFSGTGYGPAEDADGEPVTIYRDIKAARGAFSNVILADEYWFEHLSSDDIIPSGEDGCSVIDELDDDDRALLELIKEPPKGYRLFAEFVLSQYALTDSNVRGSSIRGNINLYNIVDLSTLTVHTVEEKNTISQISIFDLTDELNLLSETYRRKLQHPLFRRCNVKTQLDQSEKDLEVANKRFGIDRFSVFSSAETVLLPDTSNGNFRFRDCHTPLQFKGKCLRIDCMEVSRLARGEPIRHHKGNVNSLSSLCLVVEAEDDIKTQLGVDASIVWIPLYNQVEDLLFFERGIDN